LKIGPLVQEDATLYRPQYCQRFSASLTNTGRVQVAAAKPLSTSQFRAKLENKGIEHVRARDANYFRGLRLIE